MNIAPPPSAPSTTSQGCSRCGGNQAAVAEAKSALRELAYYIEKGTHTLRGRTAVAQLPAAKDRLREARERAAEHLREHEEVA